MNPVSQEDRRTEASPSVAERDWLSCLSTGFLHYYLTTTIVIVAALLGHDLLPQPHHPLAKAGDALHALANWDGEWYLRIVTNGYTYDATKPSSVAFFPAYPLLARSVARLTGADPLVSLLIVSHVSLLSTFVLTLAYVRRRYTSGGQGLGEYVLLSLGLFPTTLFFRMAYSESLFVFLLVLCLYGMERRWPLFVLAALVGFATATRPVGVALLPPFVLHVWHRSATVQQFGIRLIGLLPLSLWGIGAFMGYQWQAFGEPLAFLKMQANWRVYRPDSLTEKALALGTFKPIWGIFTPSAPAYWLRHTPYANPFVSLFLANPILFVAASVLLVVGIRRRWLSSYESLLAACLLLIPYLASSYEMHMAGMGRFVAAIFPLHLVLGQILMRLRGPVAAVVLSLSACLLALYAALFAAWYPIY